MSSQNTQIAMSITSPIYSGGQPVLYIGTGTNLKRHHPSATIKPNTSYYWFVAVDRRTLKVAHETLETSHTDVPAGFQTGGQYDNDNYILAFATVFMNTLYVPQGELFDFLIKNGGGRELRRLEQIFLQLNCGSYGRMCYSLVDLLGSPGVGVEVGSIHESTVSTLTLLGTDVSGTMLYTPIPLK